MTTAYLTDDAAQQKKAWGLARLVLLTLTIVLSVRVVMRSNETTVNGFRAIDFIVNCAMAASLLMIGCLELFGERVLDYDRCVIRSWLGSSLTVTLCLAVASYRLRPMSIVVLTVGIVATVFGAGIVLGVPSRDHALRGGILAVNAGVVITLAMLPTAIGTMCMVNYVFAKIAPNRMFLRVLFHLIITAMFVAWGIRFIHCLAQTPEQGTHSIVQETSNTFFLLGVSLMVSLGVILFLWGLTAHRTSPATPATFEPLYPALL